MTEGRYFGIIINTDSILTDGRVLEFYLRSRLAAGLFGKPEK